MTRSSFVTTSPDFQAHIERLMMLSSSPLPEITEFATKKPKAIALRSGSAAVPIPATASKTFTSAADLLRSVQAGVDDSADFIDEPEQPAPREVAAKRPRKTTKASKRVAKEVIVLSSDGATPNGTDNNIDTRAKGHNQNVNEGSPLGAKPWKRYKVPANTENTDLSAKTIEPQTKPKVKKKTSNGETVSRHFASKEGATRSNTRNSTPKPINLEPAVQRRRDWTPPREDSRPEAIPTPIPPSSTRPLHISPSKTSSGHEPPKENVFKNLHDAYAHKVTAPTDCHANKPQPMSLGKRKVIEMISVGQPSKQTTSDPSPIKQKAPKKKPRTITEVATAAYAPNPVDPPEDPFKEDSILEYFEVDKRGNVSKPTKGKGKGKTTRVTKKKAPPKQPVLLSPKSAKRQSARQDFVFGTSSQLVREESPTFLRDLQAALRASNVITSEDAHPVETLPRTNNLALQSATRAGGLWSVSARDEDGEVVDVKIIDFESSPFPEDDAVAILDPWKDLPPELPAASGTEIETAEPSLIEIDSMPVATSTTSSLPPVPKLHFFSTQAKITINAAAAAAAENFSDLSIRDTHPLATDLLQQGDVPPPSNQEQSQEEIRQISPSMPRKVQKTRPNYELFTDAKLAKEVSSFGFKAVKSRSGMLALLNQCWESRSRTPITAASFSTSARSPSPKGKKKAPAAEPAVTSPAPKKPRARTKKADIATNDVAAATGGPSNASSPKKRGRPRKDTLAAAGPSTTTTMAPPPKVQAASTPKRRRTTTQKAKEMIDSDADSEDSACLSSPEKTFTSPGGGAVDMSINDDTEITLDLSPTAQQSTLFSHITGAVTTAPRTTDPDNPSWHERMLMYDPVILEDLTAWLNEGQLTRVGYDGEASPMDVKKWCESKSVCCLWRGTRRGKDRKRF